MHDRADIVACFLLKVTLESMQVGGGQQKGALWIAWLPGCLAFICQ